MNAKHPFCRGYNICTRLPLAICALSTASCIGDSDSLDGNIDDAALYVDVLRIQSNTRHSGYRNSTGPAAGDIVAVEVREDGSIACTKEDSGPWTSASGGRVEFYTRRENEEWKFAGKKEYAPQPGEDEVYDLYEIVLPAGALALGASGTLEAQCIAYPYIDIPIEWPWENCAPSEAGGGIVCARSGIYSYSVDLDEVEALPSDSTPSCGEGEGEGNGSVLCSKMAARPAGIYPFDFECPMGSTYNVDLHTVSGRTSLYVTDVDPRVYATSSTTGNHDIVEFVSSSLIGLCQVYVYAEKESKFSLSIKEKRRTSHSEENLEFDDLETLVQSAQVGDILVIHRADGEKCDWLKGGAIVPALFCHAGLVTSAYPNFRTVEAAGFGHPVQEYERYEYWTTDDEVATIVALLRVPGADAEGAADAALSYIGTPYDIEVGIHDMSSFYCSKLVHAAYYDVGVDLRDYAELLFLPDDLVYSSSTRIAGYHSSYEF